MKTPIITSIIVALTATVASAAELSVFRVCQDQRVIRTSDGAEAGHVEYIVVDPSSREIVSTVVSGGVEGERLIAIPYTSLRFNGNREITLTEINRERLVSAPVIERTQISASVIEPSIIERTRTHFSARGDVNVHGDVNVRGQRNTVEGGAAATTRSNDPRLNSEAGRTNDPRANAEAATRTQAEQRQQAEQQNNNRPPATDANSRDAAAAARGQAKSPDANAENRKGEAATPDSQAAKARKGNAARSENEAATRDANAPTNESTKPTRDANSHSKAQQAERDAENAKAQQNEPNNTKGERKGAADRNANEESATGRKPAGESAESTSKQPPKKSPESGTQKSKEERPQL